MSPMNPVRGEIIIAGGYDDYQNIMILGGTWSGKQLNGNQSEETVSSGDVTQDSSGCNIRFGHASNIYLIGMRVEDNYNTHHVELGAVNGCLVSGCYFTGAHGNGSIEAVQLDITHRHTENFSGFWPYDDKPTINTTVQKCTFENLHRGVGSHHLILGAPYNNIKIINNTFRNLEDRAIAAGYFTNSEISGNTMENVNSGINISYMLPKSGKATRGQTYLKNGVDTTTERITKANLSVKNNTIQLDGTLAPWKGSSVKYGIRAGGEAVTDNNKSYEEIETLNDNYVSKTRQKDLPTGEYYVSGVTIEKNTIKASGATGNINAGIFARYLMNSTIQNNTISGCNLESILILKNGNKTSGMQLNNNNITGGKEDASAIIINASSVKEAKANQIKGKYVNGLLLISGAEITETIYDNTITGNNKAATAINVKASTAKSIKENTIKGTVKNGIMVQAKGGNSSSILTNTISGAAENGILIFSGAKVTEAVSGNTITGNNKAVTAVNVNASNAKKIQNNTIKGTVKNGIMVHEKGGKATSILTNTIGGATENGILLISSAEVTETISGNTITGNNKTMIAINVKASTVKKIQNNAIKGTVKNGILIQAKGKVTSILTNTVSGVVENGIMILNCSNSATNVNGNTITGKKTTTYGINIKGSRVGRINNNTVKGNNKICIYMHKNGATRSNVTTIYGNKVSGSNTNGIQVDGATVTNLNSNTLTSNKMFGIIVKGVADVVHAHSNTFNSNGKKNKPYVAPDSKGVFLVPGTAKVKVKQTLKLTPKLIQSTNTSKVTWKSNNTAVATVSAKGVVTGKKKGTVTITATKQKKTTICKVTVS